MNLSLFKAVLVNFLEKVPMSLIDFWNCCSFEEDLAKFVESPGKSDLCMGESIGIYSMNEVFLSSVFTLSLF